MSGVQILLLSVGGLALLCGVLIAIMRFRTIYFGAQAEGTIVGVSESSGGIRRGQVVTMYAPIVEYSAGGKKHKFTSSMATREPISKGEKVIVRYLPSDPASSAEIGTGMRMWGFPIAALLVGGIFVGLALFANVS
jgi:hypothetical protein